MKKKVFIGLQDIASFIGDWRFGAEKSGSKVMSAVTAVNNVVTNSEIEYNFSKMKRYKFRGIRPIKLQQKLQTYFSPKERVFRKSLRQCDVFIFIWSSFKADFSDYKILKRKGKKIITMFVGSDVRWVDGLNQELSGSGCELEIKETKKELESKLLALRMAEKYSDIILGQPNFMQLALKPYNNFFIPINLEEFKHNPIQRKVPVIIHAPTNPEIKGSKYIEEVIKRLKEDSVEFEYKRLEKVPREEALSIYLESDIVVDQLLLPGGGKLTHECLAMGKVVLAYMNYEGYEQKKPKDCPVIDVNTKNLYDLLKTTIMDYDSRVVVAKKGREYIDKYHNPKLIFQHTIALLENNSNQEKLEFTPNFFREQFIPESENLVVYNKWNEYVKDCDWYKKNIPSGEREGLIF